MIKVNVVKFCNLIHNKIRARKFTPSAPIGTVSFDTFNGANKNGTFQIYSFKNKDGAVIQNHSRFILNGFKKLKPRQFRHLDVEKQDVDILISQHLHRPDAVGAAINKVQRIDFLYIFLKELACEKFVIDD